MTDTIFLFMIIALFALAISDLVVGVSNDAVNFLNSAVGSKVASFRVILIIAALGVLVGATFSSGMMEVARKGIFHPNEFFFAEVMIIFLAVMITDVILLDTFNTFGLPTSTTVSIVFELLGAAVAVGVFKLYADGESLTMLSKYINSEKALAIISGILLAIAISFIVGAIVQWISRLIFSFNYHRRLKYFGAIFGGFAMAAITYFLLIKGAKGSSIFTDVQQDWIKDNSAMIQLISFVGWTLIFQVITLIGKFNVFKFIILMGTFALAMAFAGNDLVNFIGVPLAGYESYKLYMAEGQGLGANELLMSGLAGKVETKTYLLLLAGLIMVITLFMSKKAKSVLKTTVDLSRQGDGDERFRSNSLSRGIVRASTGASNSFSRIVPASVRDFINRQFQRPENAEDESSTGGASFDLVRAAVNLVVASILISIGTARKLPLSTTYVTFMVAMGTSLSDRAWGRESAVYRISGVLSVVGGWFLTALAAFSLAFLAAFILFYGGSLGLFVLLAFAVFFVIRTHFIQKRRQSKIKAREEEAQRQAVADRNMNIDKSRKEVMAVSSAAIDIYIKGIKSLTGEDRKTLKKQFKKLEDVYQLSQDMRANIYKTLQRFEDVDIPSGHHYVQVIDYVRELVHAVRFSVEPSFNHVNNNHKPLLEEQVSELNDLMMRISNFKDAFLKYLESGDEGMLPDLSQQRKEFDELVHAYRKNQIKRVKMNKSGTRNSILYLSILQESRNLLLDAVNIAKSFELLEQGAEQGI